MPRRLNANDIQATRLLRCAWRIYHGGEVTSAWIRKRFGVSLATSKRDMSMLARVLPVRMEPLVARRGVQKRISVPRTVVQPMGND